MSNDIQDQGLSLPLLYRRRAELAFMHGPTFREGHYPEYLALQEEIRHRERAHMGNWKYAPGWTRMN